MIPRYHFTITDYYDNTLLIGDAWTKSYIKKLFYKTLALAGGKHFCYIAKRKLNGECPNAEECLVRLR